MAATTSSGGHTAMNTRTRPWSQAVRGPVRPGRQPGPSAEAGPDGIPSAPAVAAPLPYPPAEHVLRDLGLEVETTPDGTARAWMPVTPQTAAPWGGTTAGVIATFVDAVSGNLAAVAARPDRVATADLALTLVHPATGPQIEATGAVVRRGRTTLVVEVQLGDVGWASATFAVLPQRADAPGPSPRPDGRRAVFGGGGRPLPAWIGDVIGLEVVDAGAGVVTAPLGAYVANSFGALQGGMVALVAEQAGAAAIGAALGSPASTVALHTAYLAQCRVGPFRTTATVLDASDASGSATVRVFDTGAGDRLTTIAHVRAVGGEGRSGG